MDDQIFGYGSTILEHFSPRYRPFITPEEFLDRAIQSRENLQIYWNENLGALVQDFREDAEVPAQPIKWEVIGHLVDWGVLVYNYEHSWERIKRWYISPEWLKEHPQK